MLSILLLSVFLLIDRLEAWNSRPFPFLQPEWQKVALQRRSFLSSATAMLTSAVLPVDSVVASASDNQNLIDVYFGCGCFWHVQHEFVEAERKILGRNDEQLTSRAAYAGGRLGMKDSKVCYHNVAQISDYGSLGHAEVVSVKIPKENFPDFAVEYCKLFRNGMRPDQLGDRGPEYRNLVGFTGGAGSDLAMQLIEASKVTGDQLDFAVGRGGDTTAKGGADSDIPRLVWIMDSDVYPAIVAENYHQFHDGFMFGEDYSNAYNSLAQMFAKLGEDFGRCPRV
ncbi:peptide methionine sulfoxide reductase [Nitzschia inconspicua]|uniref:Peptide methionine sulfoxide reductase n=1 Tax=Nitzschia inconspicua TaxID=303405 RepID=A0A9K3KQB8_9STRA|nr:peptide methionine sulfoxide reductase [Nitzschia inconspicua]KAG7347571.1 peptide methionine sulfoxide reductase [Nitzschia inconspicua]